VSLELRLLNPSDLGDLLFMYEVRRCKDVASQLLGDPPKSLEEHEAYLKKSHLTTRHFYIICAELKRVGYCQATLDGKDVELGWAIHPDYQGKGYGKGAVNMLVDVYKSQKRLVLYVKATNKKAVSIYTQAGFESLETRKGIIKMIYTGPVPVVSSHSTLKERKRYNGTPGKTDKGRSGKKR
jgi:ribosomal protein S18 acetylase RimI-like enzyme